MSEHLKAAARRRHEETERRALETLRQMSKEGSPVNFVAVARRARVSTDFLYRHTSLRKRIETMRAVSSFPQRPAEPQERTVDGNGTSSAVLALSRQLKEMRKRHHEEIISLKQALAVAHGENLELRRKLSPYAPERPQ